ncbi:MAG: family 20 glycosylhydrolase [Clostridia bacterium]|nr:family 20 glycosylhydrolase [Clostridia bacterium]
MFITAKTMSHRSLVITENTKVTIPKSEISEYARNCIDTMRQAASSGDIVCNSITFVLGIPKEVREKVEKTKRIKGDPEEYVISLGKESFVYGTEYIGFLRAVSTIMQMSSDGELSEAFIYDYPACSLRGYRVYLPGRETYEDFKKMIDFIVYYKYNTLILEIGGAMEYKRHPKINEKWVEFCKECSKYSGRADEIQGSQRWPKNSIHYENGDGAYLTQEECRELAEYCRHRGLEIIPECPTLSHTDYICHAYPELAERKNDPYPDTLCPSNPMTYKVEFDVLDEVIEVFRPKRINIGHDEFYSAGICDKCKGKAPSDIYAEDVKIISEYLDERGVETLMWGEKLVKARYTKGERIGGWYDEQIYNGAKFKIPEIFMCADKMPEGVTYIHWYWRFGEHLDDEFHARNYPVVFGNFSAIKCDNYKTRIGRGVLGGIVSNWGSNAEEYMQRNDQYYDLVTSGYALWSDTYDDHERETLHNRAALELYRKHNQNIKNPIKVRHAAHYYVESPMFWDGVFILDEKYLLGKYKITYSDKTEAFLPVKFGTNIGPYNSPIQSNFKEVLYSTLPIKNDYGYLFEHLYDNPHPQKQIERIEYIPEAGKEDIKITYEFDINKKEVEKDGGIYAHVEVFQ